MASITQVKVPGCFLLLLISLAPFLVFAQERTVTQAAAAENKQTAGDAPVSLKDYREILQQERKLLDDQSEKYYTRIDKLVDRTTYGMGLLVLVALALFWWVFGKTRKDLEAAIRADLEKDIRLSLQKDLDRIQAEVAALRDSRRVFWVFNADTTNVEKDKMRLQATGLKNIAALPAVVGETANLSQFDLVILSYDGSPKMSQKLKEIIANLDQDQDKTPLLIHAPNATVPPDEIALLDNYQAYSMAKVRMVFYDRVLSLSRLGKIQK